MAPPAVGDFHEDVDSLLDDIPSELVTDKKFVLSKFKSAAVMDGPIDFKTQVDAKGGKFAGKVSGKWANKASGFSITKAELCPTNGISKFEFKAAKLPVAGAVVAVKTVPSKSSGSVECTYSNDALIASLLVKADSLKYTSATAGATMAYDGIRVGGEVSLEDSLKDVWVGLGYQTGKYDATIEAKDMMKTFTVKALAKPTGDLTLACMAESDLKNKTTGAALCGYKLNAKTGVKAKYDASTLKCAITYKALPKVTVVGGVGIPLAAGEMTTGLALTMG